MSRSICHECGAPDYMWGDCEEQDCGMPTVVVERGGTDNSAVIAELETEIERLRAALERIAPRGFNIPPLSEAGAYCVAKQALAAEVSDE